LANLYNVREPLPQGSADCLDHIWAIEGETLKKISFRISSATLVAVLSVAWLVSANPPSPSSLLQLTPQDALETHGLSAFLFHNSYHGVFGDEKMSGLEIIFHEQRIATNGDVRLWPTPAQ
jgi:endoglucanase